MFLLSTYADRINSFALTNQWEVRENFADGGRWIPERFRRTLNHGVGLGNRYRNPLDKNQFNDLSDPMHRFYIAYYDKLGRKLTYTFIERALAKDFAFYPSQDMYAEKFEWSDALIAKLYEIGAFEWINEAAPRQLIHGYQITKPELTKKGIPTIVDGKSAVQYIEQWDFSKCYSDHEIHGLVPNNHGHEMFIRASEVDIENVKRRIERGEPIEPVKLNQILGVKINFIPELPLFRGRGNLKQINEKWELGEYLHTTHIAWERGYGHSVFADTWDAIIKLMEKSERDHFRQDLFTVMELNPEWKGNAARSKRFVQNFLYALNNRQVFAYHKYLDMDGKPQDLPNIKIQNTVQTTQPTKGQSTGIGALTDSEWSSLTAATGYSISYFMGDPAGAISAANTDKMADLNNDVTRFSNISRFLIKPFLKTISALGILDDLFPEGMDWDRVVIKTWWQVEYENLQKSLYEASHFASGIAMGKDGRPQPSIPKKQEGLGTKKNELIAQIHQLIPNLKNLEDMSIEELADLFEVRENVERKKYKSEYKPSQQKPEIGEAKKAKAKVGQIRELPYRECIKKARAKIRESNPKMTPQEIESKAKKMCKSEKAKTSKKGSVKVTSHTRDEGKTKIGSHTRGSPDKPDHPVKVSGYSRDGEKVKGYTRNTESRQEWIDCCIDEHGPDGDGTMTPDQCVAAGYDKFPKRNEAIIYLNGYMVSEYGANVELIQNRFEVEFNMNAYEKVGEPTEVMCQDITSNKFISLDDEKTKSLIKFFEEDWKKTPLDLPPLIVDENLEVMDGHHRYYVYRKFGFSRCKVQFMKPKNEPNYELTASKMNFVMPMSAVASSHVKGVGLRGKDVIVQFHPGKKEIGSGKTYKYIMSDEDTAQESYEDLMQSTSKGGYIWDKFRGTKMGPAWGTGKPTPGGTSSSMVPYELMGRSSVSKFGGHKEFEQTAKDLKEFKEQAFGKKRAYYPEQVGEKRFDPKSEFYSEKYQHGFAGGQPLTKAGLGQAMDLVDEMKSKMKKTNEIVHGTPFKKKRNEFPREWTMHDVDYYFGNANQAVKLLGGSKSKYYKMKSTPNETVRYNRYKPVFEKEDDEYWYAIVNGYSTTNSFQYLVNGRVQVEYQCPDDIKAQVGKEVSLGVYHNLENPQSPDLPDWQIVGSYLVLGYDEEDETDIARLKINKRRIQEVFGRLGEEDWITPIFNDGKVPDISTAYPAKVVWNDDKEIYVQTNTKLTSVSIVKKGNCSAPYCTGTQIRENGVKRTCIQNEIAILSTQLRENGKSIDMDEIIKKANEKCKLIA